MSCLVCVLFNLSGVIFKCVLLVLFLFVCVVCFGAFCPGVLIAIVFFLCALIDLLFFWCVLLLWVVCSGLRAFVVCVICFDLFNVCCFLLNISGI